MDAGKVPLLSLDDDPSWDSGYVAPLAQYLNQINVMGSNDTCANNCASGQNALNMLTSRGVPASRLIDGIGIEQGYPDATDPADCGAKAQYLSQTPA